MARFGFYKDNAEKNRLQLAAGWIVDILAAAALAVFVVSMFLNPRTVNGRSMEPALYPEDRVLLSRISPDLLPYRRFDIVSFSAGEGSRDSLKRIVGLPGETVQIAGGIIYINGTELEEGPFAGRPVPIAGLAEEEISLAEDEYFLLGDNAGSSEDSRFANIGNVKQEQIEGRLWLRVKPSSRFGLLP